MDQRETTLPIVERLKRYQADVISHQIHKA